MSEKNIVMRIPEREECVIVKRLNRFVVEIEVAGITYRAYINNTGRLLEYMVRGRRAYCLERKRPGKTSYRLFAVEDMGAGALIDTRMQMDSFEKLVHENMIPWLRGCRVKRGSPRLGSSVLDYLLECGGRLLYVEIKSAVMRGDTIYAMYPDCPTLRGRRHIRELTRHANKGGWAAIVFIAGLPGVKAFKPYGEGDPEIPGLLWEAARAGVMIKSINIYYVPRESAIILANPDLPVILQDPAIRHGGG